MGPIPFSSCERFLLCSPPFFRHVFFSIPVIIVENPGQKLKTKRRENGAGFFLIS